MFRMLARLLADPTLSNPTLPPAADAVFTIHPLQLSRWLEEIWGAGGIASWPAVSTSTPPLGDPAVTARLRLPDGLRDVGLSSGIRPGSSAYVPPPPPALGLDLVPLPWDHLIYAYLVESTGVVEVLGEVVRRYTTGESLDPPSVETLTWVRATEELLFRDAPLFHVGSTVSSLRPDASVNRRNAYWRMFGCDLPHPLPSSPDGSAWKRPAGSGVNTRFIEIWNELLRQVWLGIEHDRNSVGANPTDPNYVGYLCQTLGEMLRLRRRGGLLAREEFTYVAMMSWLHLTLESDTPLVRDLKATASGAGNPADRLSAIAARVGMTSPRGARELFELAVLVSPLLWFIELDQFSDAADASVLFRSFGVTNPPVPTLMMRVIDMWQSATGTPVKALATTTRTGSPALPRPAQPIRLPAGIGAAALPEGAAAVRNGAARVPS